MSVVDFDRLSRLLGIEGDRSLCVPEMLQAAQSELAMALDLIRRAYIRAAIEAYKVQSSGETP